MSSTLADQLAVEEVGPGQYTSKVLARRMGNPSPIAYGGCTLATAVRAACATVPAGYALYSVTGHFLGPASILEKVQCTVTPTRDTKTFATRRVEVSQVLPGKAGGDPQRRVCMELLADFQVIEPALLSYSAPPVHSYSGPEASRAMEKLNADAVAEGKLSAEAAAANVESFATQVEFFDARLTPEGVAGQTSGGIVFNAATTQDHLPITAKGTGDWVRTRVPLGPSHGERAAALAFLMDGALSFTPLQHNHMWFGDAGACSTLDFALRVFVPDVDISQWHLRERTTSAAGYGRTYSEARLWDEQGTLVSSMTQQCILRPKPELKEKSSL
ncbi:thioesterase-like superfamily-domain-containing protein [Xylariales sp. PMI_506]|nr:thioesterase-like superfamily-domain-containing protein [Xylariales sp. PMI_506]